MAKSVSIPGIGRASAFLASGTMVSRILGFVKAILIARTIGQTGVSGDAFAAANQLPNTIFMIIAGGVLSAILVPQIVKATVHADRGAAYINKLITITLTVLVGATLIAMASAPMLVKAYAAGFGAEQAALATAFALWCLPQLFFYGLYSVLGEILNAHKIFGPFTWSPALNNVVAIAGLFVFIGMFGADSSGLRAAADWTPMMIAVLAGTTTLGVAAQALILFKYWKQLGLRFRLDFGWRGVGLAETGRLAGWSFAMLLVTTLAGVVQSQVVSVASGDNASTLVIQNSWLIFMLPHSVLAVSLTTAYFTRMAEHARAQDYESLKADVSAALRNVSMMIVLAAAVLLAVAFPFGMLFSSEPWQGIAMGWVIIAFVLGLVPFCFLFVLQRTFYALGDTRTPFFFTVFQTVLFCLMALTCLLLPHSVITFGVALSTSLAGTAQALLAFFLLRRRLHGLDVQQILNSMAIFTFSAIPAFIVGIVTVMAMGGLRNDGWSLSSAFSSIVTMIVAGVVISVVYLFFLWVLRARELSTLAAPFRKILRKVRRS